MTRMTLDSDLYPVLVQKTAVSELKIKTSSSLSKKYYFDSYIQLIVVFSILSEFCSVFSRSFTMPSCI